MQSSYDDSRFSHLTFRQVEVFAVLLTQNLTNEKCNPLWNKCCILHRKGKVLSKQFTMDSPLYGLFFRINGEEVRLMLWDTAGQEEFDAITKVLLHTGMGNIPLLKYAFLLTGM